MEMVSIKGGLNSIKKKDIRSISAGDGQHCLKGINGIRKSYLVSVHKVFVIQNVDRTPSPLQGYF
jgi:hypothetical protein